jgi:hypothetical protein
MQKRILTKRLLELTPNSFFALDCVCVFVDAKNSLTGRCLAIHFSSVLSYPTTSFMSEYKYFIFMIFVLSFDGLQHNALSTYIKKTV